MSPSLEQLKYPIGHYLPPDPIPESLIKTWISEIQSLPAALESALAGMTDTQLDTPYRPGGWTVRQLVHHLADSHVNAHCRLRLALTEDGPTIKPYEQDEWAELADVKNMPVVHSLNILTGLHARWAFLLKNLSSSQFQRVFVHPEYQKTYSIGEMTGLYAWHGKHHLAHITELKKRNGW